MNQPALWSWTNNGLVLCPSSLRNNCATTVALICGISSWSAFTGGEGGLPRPGNATGAIDGTHIPIKAPKENPWGLLQQKSSFSFSGGSSGSCGSQMKVINCEMFKD